MWSHFKAAGAMLLASLMLTGCASAPRQFDGDVVWEVNDRRPVEKPAERWAPKYWDPADYILFRPLSHVWLLETREPAKNANAWGHVPDSSWFTNRLSLHDIPADRIARGPCDRKEMPRGERWVVKSGKVGGNNPGFVIEVEYADGSKDMYLLKFDGELQTERATAADVIGSRIYWAAGYEAPCNRIAYFERDKLMLADDATRVNRVGRESPLTVDDLEEAMRFAPRLEDGRIRAVSSKFLPGEPIGPFSYDGRRRDDLNDTIDHETRRELRGGKLIAAWMNHFDAREQNTFTSFIRDGDSDLGYVQHFMLDFGDSFGSQWPSDQMTRRFGYSWYVDPGHIFSDLLTLGAISRPWHDVRTYERAEIFGYFDVEHFEPASWKAGSPNISFREMDARDAFWATNIISRFGEDHIEAMVRQAKFTKPIYTKYLTRVLIGRRDKIVEEYFRDMSPLVEPTVEDGRLCVSDAWVTRGYGAAADAFYDLRTYRWQADSHPEPVKLSPETNRPGVVCVPLPEDHPTQHDLVISLRVRRVDQRDPASPARFVMRRNEANDWRVVGILRVGEAP